MKYYYYIKNKLKKLVKSIALKNKISENDRNHKKAQIFILSSNFNYRTLVNLLQYSDYKVHFFSFTPKNLYNF